MEQDQVSVTRDIRKECNDFLDKRKADHAESFLMAQRFALDCLKLIDSQEQIIQQERERAANIARSWYLLWTIDRGRRKTYGAAIAEKILESGESSGQHPEDRCQACGANNVVWHAPNDVWNAVMGSEAGILCPKCFVMRADAMGLYQSGGWRLAPESVWEQTVQQLQADLAAYRTNLQNCNVEIEQLQADKERLDWLEYNTDKIISKTQWPTLDNCFFREAIDAARGVQLAKEGTDAVGR